MLCVPVARFEVLNCAELAATPPVPICVEPSRNATVPVGEPEPDCGATFAVKLTLAPEATWVAEALSVVLVATFDGAVTVTVIEFEVDEAKFESPEYATLSECAPTASVLVLYVAAEAASVAVATCVEPSRMLTVPVGVPLPD